MVLTEQFQMVCAQTTSLHSEYWRNQNYKVDELSLPTRTQFKLSEERNTTHMHIILVLPSTGMQRNQCSRFLRYGELLGTILNIFSRYMVCDKVIDI
jgi:hypothetical protein